MARSNDPLVVGRVIGDVLEEFQPFAELTVKYAARQVSNGCELKPSAVAESPLVQVIDRNEPNALFTLVVTDPDAPSPSEPSSKEFLHWLVTDIPSGADASAGRQILPYEEPKPPIGIHRYVFAVFKQQQPLPLIAPSTRKKFNTKGFAQQFGLGKPAAAVYFNSQKGDRSSTALDQESLINGLVGGVQMEDGTRRPSPESFTNSHLKWYI